MLTITQPQPPFPLPLLITGISGVAGYNAFHYFRQCFPGRVIGIRSPRTPRLVGDGIVPLNAEDRAGMRELFGHYRFRGVLNCAGNCALKSCELDPAMARQANVASVDAIRDNVHRHGCRLVHLSSDLVFSGKGDGKYVETDPVDPVTIYGQTMAEGEQRIAARVPGAAILRISLPMGPSFNRHAGAIDWIQSRFRAQRPATLYYDEVRSCTYVADLNEVFAFFLTNELAGVYHAGGPRALALYQIAQIVNRVGGYEPRWLTGCYRHEAGPMPPRAGNVSMRSDKLSAAMGRPPFAAWPSDDDLVPTDRHWHHQRPAAEAGCWQRLVEHLYHYPSYPGKFKPVAP
ncbi:MAG: SDR family oxidoreductase [Gemmataceae bacterium]